jgi:spoIIIJ-associated protein
MRDQVFTGRDVQDALSHASQALGLKPADLRYVVLEAGDAGGRGLSPTPARIAVLMGGAGGSLSGRAPSAAEAWRPTAPRPGARAQVVAAVRELARAGELDLSAELEENEEGLILRIEGADREFLLGGDAEVFKALEHVLQRMAHVGGEPRRLVVSCEGYRSHRDEALKQQALKLAEAVRADGQPRRTGPLNSYERRIIHVALSEVPEVRTFSVGEGSDRRVTIALASGPTEPAAEPPAEE